MKKFLLLLLLPLLLVAENEVEKQTDITIVPAGQVINDDYFAWGGTVEIAGTVNGDVYLFGSQVFIDGTINGDLLVMGGSVNISGRVTQDARLIAGQVMLSGDIGRNLTMLAGNCEFTSNATVGRNLTTCVGNIDLAGELKNNGLIYASNLRLSDTVGGKIDAYVGSLRVTSTVKMGGPLEYSSDNLALIDKGAQIPAGVTHHPSFIYNLSQHPLLKWLKIGSKLATVLMNFFYSLILGLLFMRYYPQKVERSLQVMKEKPWQALLTGCVMLVLLPLIALLLLLTILGAPFALTLLAINVIGFYTAKVFTILWASDYLFQRSRRFRKLYFTLLLITYFLITAVPYIGTAVATVAMIFGLGAIVQGRADLKA